MTASALITLWAACGIEPIAPLSEPMIPVYGDHVVVAVAESDALNESSGIVASRRNRDLYWTHNDSGGESRVFAFRLSPDDLRRRRAKDLGYIELPGTDNVDWEDIATGPDRTIYVFDGGDNPPCKRANKRLIRFAEPAIDPDGPPVALKAAVELLRFEYPDRMAVDRPTQTEEDRYDAECLMVHPETGDVYIVTKRDDNNSVTARVYMLPEAAMRWNTDRVHVLKFVTDLSSVTWSMVTGGDVAPDGGRVVIRDYTAAYEFVLPDGEGFETIFAQRPEETSLLGELQGEGICYTADGRDLVTTSEVKALGPKTMPVFLTPREGERPMTSAATRPAGRRP